MLKICALTNIDLINIVMSDDSLKKVLLKLDAKRH